MLLGLRLHYPHPRLGACNGVTLLRAAMVSVLAAALLLPMRADDAGLAWALAALALAALLLDGVDGWAARRARLTSGFGARFDMEVDVVFALVLAIMVWQGGTVGIWVLALGLLHPAFLLASLIWPALRAPLPDARWRKVLCVAQMLALIALITPAMPAALAPWLAAGILAVLVAGFGRDIFWLVRRAG
ncbi:MAG: CDP-alcohol phosphatidyltransferase family protein [Rhodobacteraceae bacterium]|nr:CDP-alcohol phosphatidyltransferase family protein [Paracoccaceae bacterium]